MVASYVQSFPISRKLTGKNAIVDYLDYQIPVTQLKGPTGNGDMQGYVGGRQI